MRTWVALILVVASIQLASAQPAPSDKTEADALFEEGRKLLTAGHTDEACAKFDRSFSKDPRAVGTLLNLALCKERQGKVASALTLFREAFDRASEQNLPGQRQAAQQEIATLTAQVPIVVVKLAAPPIADTKLVIDDNVVPLDSKELALDPGHHGIVVTAPGRLPYQTALELRISSRTELVLPALALPKSRTIVKVERDSWRRVWGKVGTFGGAGLVVTALGFGTYAKIHYDAQQNDPDGAGPLLPHCGQRPLINGKIACDKAGKAAVDRSRVFGNAATVLGIAGAVTGAVGVYLWSTAPRRETNLGVTPTAGPEGAGVVLFGSF